jgi:hypothetical protein
MGSSLACIRPRRITPAASNSQAEMLFPESAKPGSVLCSDDGKAPSAVTSA